MPASALDVAGDANGARHSTAQAAVAVASPHSVTVAQPEGQPFSEYLWGLVKHGIFEAILAHPFLRGLVDGTLDERAFRYYLTQDALYLREYGRALVLAASKAPRIEWTAFFAECAQETFKVETEFHKEFFGYFSTTVEAETASAVRSPNNVAYTSFLLASIHDHAFHEGLAAVLPCFVVYMEVGKALQKGGSRHPLYQKWIDKYGGPEFEAVVLKVVQMVNEVAAELMPSQKARMAEKFLMGCRFEWLFWDGAYHQQAWPC